MRRRVLTPIVAIGLNIAVNAIAGCANAINHRGAERWARAPRRNGNARH